jgi:hypothetical protein
LRAFIDPLASPMMDVSPTTFLDYAMLFLGTFIAASALSILLPLRWGWKAFPLVILGLVLAVAAIVIASIRQEQGTAWGAEGSAGLLLSLLVTAALAFTIIRAVRLRRDNKG